MQDSWPSLISPGPTALAQQLAVHGTHAANKPPDKGTWRSHLRDITVRPQKALTTHQASTADNSLYGRQEEGVRQEDTALHHRFERSCICQKGLVEHHGCWWLVWILTPCWKALSSPRTSAGWHGRSRTNFCPGRNMMEIPTQRGAYTSFS